MVRFLRNILILTIQIVVIVNLTLIVALNIPKVQSTIGEYTSELLSDLLHTEVSVGRVDIMLNQLVITDVEVKDQQRQPLLSIKKLAGKVDLLRLKPNLIAFNTIQLLHFRAHLNQSQEGAPMNFQFIIDALSNEEKSDTKTNFRINSLIVREGEVCFDKLYLPKKGSFDINHILIRELDAHLSLKSIVSDSIRLRLRQLSFKEQSGLDLRNMSFTVTANQHEALVTQFLLNFPHTTLKADTLHTLFDLNAKDVLNAMHSHAKLEISPLTLSDFAFIVPKLSNFDERINTVIDVQQEGREIVVNNIQIATESQNIQFQSHARIHLPADSLDALTASTEIQQLIVQPSAYPMLFNNLQLGNTPPMLTRLGRILYAGELKANGDGLHSAGIWNTAVGQVRTDMVFTTEKKIRGAIETGNLNVGQLTGNQKLGEIAGRVQFNGLFINGKPSGKVLGDIASFEYNNYTIHNTHIDAQIAQNEAQGSISFGDENLQLDLNGYASLSKQRYDIQAQFLHMRPCVIGFQPERDRIYSGEIDASLQGNDINNLLGSIDINNFGVQDSTSTYHMGQLKLRAVNESGQRRVSLYSDFMTADVRGEYTYTTLPQSVVHVLERYIPALIGYRNQNTSHQNHFTFNVKLTDATPLKQVLALPVELQEPITLVGFFNDPENKLDVDLIADSFDYSGSHYEQARLRCQNSEESFITDLGINKFNKSSMVSLGLHAKANADRVEASINWDNNKKTGSFRGQLNAHAIFEKQPGMPMDIGVLIHPSDVTVNDTTWNIRPAQIHIKGKEYAVNNLTIENGDRRLRLHGAVSENPNDSLIAELKEINVDYVLRAVNFDAVSFSGYATGKAYASDLLHDMKADTQLFVRDLHFQGGQMGNMNLYGRWENEKSAIYLNGHITEFGGSDISVDSTQVWNSWHGLGNYIGRTHAEGRISPKYDTIDLMINAENTNVAFLQGFVGNVFDNISGRTTGWCHIGNTLKDVDITAQMKADMKAKVRSLNTTYNIKTDSIQFITNRMRFINVDIIDKDGRKGLAQGDVRHDYLRRMKYEFRIHTDNLLCYETHDFGDGMPFYATAYTGGDISIIGGGGRLDINADVTANAGSTLVYNATTPEEVSNTNFITFVDKTPRELDVLNVLPTAENDKKRKDKEEESTDIYIDFNVNMTPEATIRVLMDRASGDYISANGTGNLKASYYNKGSFKMFGLYDITKGMYRMSMQEVIRKEFNFRDGGTVTFNGDPFLAQLDVKANYTVNSASLRDLSPTATFTQKSSTRVNCIMNIEGSLKKPSITFDLELPTVSEEDKSMVKSLVATEEQMNMQIIYLLGVGRFYGGDYTQDTADQTNLAMNSFLASTLSGQFNQMLSQVINSSNWNLGASINPGQSGTNNMEFQTMLQGSLFNNRLLINGNFGYKENVMMNNNFVGDFDIQWFINNARTISLKAYNETNERYFTRNTLNTQGLGIQFRYEFERWNDLFRFTRKKNKSAR